MRTFGTATLRIKDGDGCVVGANARDDAVRSGQVVRLAHQLVQIEGDDDVSDLQGFFAIWKVWQKFCYNTLR